MTCLSIMLDIYVKEYNILLFIGNRETRSNVQAISSKVRDMITRDLTKGRERCFDLISQVPFGDDRNIRSDRDSTVSGQNSHLYKFKFPMYLFNIFLSNILEYSFMKTFYSYKDQLCLFYLKT